MKMSLLVTLLLLMALTSSGQFLGGIFSQNKTELKYYLAQITALKAYKGVLKTGYNVVKDGSGLIRDIKNGEFSLHKNYFNSLSSVSARVSRYPKAEAIFKMESDITVIASRVGPYLSQMPEDKTTELRSMLRSCSEAAAIELDELLLILDTGETEMTEDARLQAIDRIYLQVQRLYGGQLQLLRHAYALSEYYRRQQQDIFRYKKIRD